MFLELLLMPEQLDQAEHHFQHNTEVFGLENCL